MTVKLTILLVIVMDPFANMPFVAALLLDVDNRRYRRVILRETTVALGILTFFLLTGPALLNLLNINPPAIKAAGGSILFLISLKLIFRSSQEIFGSRSGTEPLIVPIATPAIAGPSAVATILLVHSQAVGFVRPFLALVVAVGITSTFLLFARPITRLLKDAGMNALEKLTGMLLNIIAISILLEGIREFFGS